MIDRLEHQIELLERHMEVLELVVNHAPAGIVSLSHETGHEFHEIRYSLRILEGETIIEPSREGAVPTENAGKLLSEHGASLHGVIEQLEGLKNNS